MVVLTHTTYEMVFNKAEFNKADERWRNRTEQDTLVVWQVCVLTLFLSKEKLIWKPRCKKGNHYDTSNKRGTSLVDQEFGHLAS